jgi:3D (Asp-Asp-Asp) domain-containing protein
VAGEQAGGDARAGGEIEPDDGPETDVGGNGANDGGEDGTGEDGGDGEPNRPGQEGDWADVDTPDELRAWQNQYRDNAGYGGVLANGGTRNPDGTLTLPSRLTSYGRWENGDPNSNNGVGSFGSLRTYDGAGTYGSAAVDPSVIPYGSVIRVNGSGGARWYVAEDIGTAVVNRQASGGSRPVVDLYTSSQADGGNQTVTVYPYTGGTPYSRMSASQRASYLNGLGYSQ